jgi:hypothetical protein
LPSPPTPQQRAEAKQRERAAREQARPKAARASEARRWAAGCPTNGSGGPTEQLARLDRDLVYGIIDLDSAIQRAAAGLTDLDWVKPALAALERGESLPFADLREAFGLLDADSRVRRTTVASDDGRHEHVSQQHMAVPALWSAAADDPLGAGLECLFQALDRLLAPRVRGARRVPELVEPDPRDGRRLRW